MNGYPLGIWLNVLCKEGMVEKAEWVLKKEIENGLAPDVVLYNTMVSEYCRIGDVNGAIWTVDQFEKHQLRPNCITFNLLVNKAHCELKDFNGAYARHREMFENGFLLNFSICSELVTGLRKEGMLQEARIICSEMSSRGMDGWRTYEDLFAVAKV
ncbi:hypothetical protein SLE2022_112120 [Rubroshorea leprosula]